LLNSFFGILLIDHLRERRTGYVDAWKLVRQRLSAGMSAVRAEAEIGKKLGTGAIDPKPTLVISVI
jgi:hypothetical protein